MPKTKEYPLEIKKAVIRALKERRTQISISRDYDISRQLVNVWKHCYETRGDVHNKSKPGRPRKTTIKEDKIIKR